MRIFLLLLTWISFSSPGSSQAPKKIALIVAVSDYPESLGWTDLHSKNDVKIIKDVLLNQGFKPENIAVLMDKQATMNGILSAIDRELIKKAAKGDIAVFHFSGHGQQIEDDVNPDEADGLDESLIPYDAPFEFRPGPDNHLRDDILGAKLSALRKNLGPEGNLLVLIDACHSGTITRGGGIKRGTNEIYSNPANKGKLAKINSTTDANFGITEDEKDLAPMACFFASSPSETNTEAVLPGDIGAGSLTVAFSRSMANADTRTTYRALFDNIKLEMSSLVTQQTPLAEGDLDKILFGGKAVAKPVYYQLRKDTATKSLTLPIGKIFGVYENTTIKLYKPDTRPADTAGLKPLATGRISEAGAYTSDVVLDTRLTDKEMLSAWVYLDEINYGDLTLRVKNNIADAELKKVVTAQLAKIRQSKQSDDVAHLFIESGGNNFHKDSITLVNSDGLIIWQTIKVLPVSNLYDSLSTRINDYARAKYVRNLALENPEFKVTVEMVPQKCISGCSTSRSAVYEEDKEKSKLIAAGKRVFRPGDKFRLKITSHSDQRILYYTVLDIQPDNIVNVMIPGKRTTPEDHRILQGETVILKNLFNISPPYGTDVIKVIATEDPIDLKNVFDNRGKTPLKRGSTGENPFERIMKGTFSAEGPKTRGAPEDVIAPDAVNISTIRFEIVR